MDAQEPDEGGPLLVKDPIAEFMAHAEEEAARRRQSDPDHDEALFQEAVSLVHSQLTERAG